MTTGNYLTPSALQVANVVYSSFLCPIPNIEVNKLVLRNATKSVKSEDKKFVDPFDPEATVPLPFQLDEHLGPYSTSVWKRNERERCRVRCVNEGYEKLRTKLPLSDDKRISKVDTLRLAVRYIQHLSELLKNEDHAYRIQSTNDMWADSYVDPEMTCHHEPVDDEDQAMNVSTCSWQLLSVSLHRAVNLGFGIAISGGRDNPHFTSGDPVVVISDVVPNGPAWGLLQLNDRILSANNVSFENIDYATAVDIIKNAEHINMIVKRRVAVPVMEFEQRTLKFTLSKSRKKDDFGIVLGCKFYIKEIRNPKLAEKDPGLREGDSVLRINGQSVDDATLEDVNKWLERSREKLCLVIQRDVRRGSTSRWPSQNTVYERVGSVSATPRHSPSPMLQHPSLQSHRGSHEYVNSPRWRPDGSLDERRVSSPAHSSISNSIIGPTSMQASSAGLTPLPGTLEYEYFNRHTGRPVENSGIRSVVFRKVGGSVGVRVIGGNQVGIFVSAVAADSPAAIHGVCPGDRILEVNGKGMRGVTREHAVQLLLGLEDRVALQLEHARNDFEHVKANQLGDNFYIRAHFSKEKKSNALEMTINEGDIFHVTDTLFGGTVGMWQAARVYSAAHHKGEPVKGVIPNQATAETIAEQFRLGVTKAKASSASTGGTLLRRKFESRRSKSLSKNCLGDPTELLTSIKTPAYERVALNTPSFFRPIVLFGPLADIARHQLLTKFSARFAEPENDGGVIRLSSVDHIIAVEKHCVLDISVESVERLQLAQYAPIVVLLDVDGRSRIRDMRKKLGGVHLSTRKLAEQAAQIKKHHGHLLSATVDATHEESWFDALRDLVAHLQQRRLWMPEFPPNIPLEDVVLFQLSKGDQDTDSLRGDYSEYSRREDSLPRTMDRNYAASNNNVNQLGNKPKYDWEDSGISSSQPPYSLDGSSANSSESSAGVIRTSTNNGVTYADNQPLTSTQSPMMSAPSRMAPPPPPLAIQQQSPMTTSTSERQQPQTPGYYHVKQLLNEDTLYQDARIANEIANARLREEARIRDDRAREDQRIMALKKERNESHPLQPPTADMYTYREEHSPAYQKPALPPTRSAPPPRPTIAPKPASTYIDSVVRNRWPDQDPRVDTPSSIGSAAHLNPSSTNGTNGTTNRPTNGARTNGSASPAIESVSLTVASHSSQPSSPAASPYLQRADEERTSRGQKENLEDYEEPVVVEESSMSIGSSGGVLRCENSQVELIVPPGAIPDGETHEIYVKVCREGSSPPIDKSKGETLLSPLVMCGPQGLKFLKECELRLPHTGGANADGGAGDESWSFSLKAGDGDQWKHLDVPDKSSTIGDDKFLSVPIHHF